MEPEWRNFLPATSEMNQFPRILLVEDTPLNQVLVLKQLERLGYQADLAENGQQALDRLSQAQYDIVLMDCQMPVLDGYSTAQIIRDSNCDSWAHLVIIAMTANATSTDQRRCLEVGMDDYLGKPVSKETLADRLDYWKKKLSQKLGPEASVSANSTIADPSTIVNPSTIADPNEWNRQTKQNTEQMLTESNAKPTNLGVKSGAAPNSASSKIAPQRVSEQPLIDWDYLQNATSGDEAFSWDLLQVFIEENQPLLLLLAEAIAQEDLSQVKQVAHRIKGSAGNVGLPAIYQIAARLETQATRQEWSGMKLLCEQISDLTHQLETEIKARDQK